MNQISDEIILREIRYLDPELSKDREFLRVLRQRQRTPLAIRFMIGLIIGTIGLDALMMVLLALHVI